MPPGESAESRRRFTKGIFDIVVTRQSMQGHAVSEDEIIDRLRLDVEFTEEFARDQIRRLGNHTPCPLERIEDCEHRAYEVTRPGELSDYLNGLREDGDDPAEV